MIRRIGFCALVLTLVAASAPARAQEGKPDKTIALGEGGFDYLFADSGARRLYVAHSSAIEVIDLDTDEKVGRVEGVDGAHGTAIATAAKRGFATAGKKQKLIAFDLETLKVVKEIDTGAGPDAVLYVASVDEVWSMNHRAGTVTCVDVKSLEVKATIEIGGALEFAVELGDRVYVNVEDKKQVAVLDPKKHEVVARHELPAEEPAGLAADAKNGLLFVGCGSKKLVVLEAATGKALAQLPIGSHCDAVAFDATTGKVFASCADGSTSVVLVKDATTFEALPAIPTARGGKCCAVDPTTHKLYVAVAPRPGEKGESKVLVFATKP
jgi:DNA-binding beta-propeller fold protein YncE